MPTDEEFVDLRTLPWNFWAFDASLINQGSPRPYRKPDMKPKVKKQRNKNKAARKARRRGRK